MSMELGVLDAQYVALMDRLTSGEVTSTSFRREFYRAMQSDGRVDDDERYRILQKVFFACEDLVVEDDLREEGEIDEAVFRDIVTEAARALRHREVDWEGQAGQQDRAQP